MNLKKTWIRCTDILVSQASTGKCVCRSIITKSSGIKHNTYFLQSIYKSRNISANFNSGKLNMFSIILLSHISKSPAYADQALNYNLSHDDLGQLTRSFACMNNTSLFRPICEEWQRMVRDNRSIACFRLSQIFISQCEDKTMNTIL